MVKNDTREYILVTSLKLFMKKSFKDVTMSDIVKATNLSKGAFYHYFESKDAVFEEVVKYFYDHVMITDYSSFPQTSLKDFYIYYLDKLQRAVDGVEDADDTNIFVFLSDASRKIPSFQNIHTSQRNKEIEAWSDAVARAKATDELRTDIANDDVAKMFIDMSDGIAFNKSLGHKSEVDNSGDIQKCWDNLYCLLIPHAD